MVNERSTLFFTVSFTVSISVQLSTYMYKFTDHEKIYTFLFANLQPLKAERLLDLP